VIEHCGLVFRVPPPADRREERLVYLGDDEAGNALEVVAIEVEGDGLLVIHAMTLRARYRASYEEATRWRI
jgi:hypothetical protein